jgi:hypothetical protein
MLIAGAVVLTAGVTAPGVAAAQETVSERNAMRAETPWYERFTYSQGPSEQAAALGPVERRGAPAITLSPKWGVTVNLREAERTVTTRQDESGRAAVGAYYQFTPSVRVGGQVSVGAPRLPAAPAARGREEEPAAGVRLESAFRF